MALDNQRRDEPVIRDKRRIDPETGEIRRPAVGGAAADVPTAGAANAAGAGAPASAPAAGAAGAGAGASASGAGGPVGAVPTASPSASASAGVGIGGGSAGVRAGGAGVCAAARAAGTGGEAPASLTVEDILNAAPPEGDELGSSGAEAEHLADLKRVTAEYANYRKRTEANRESDRQRAVGTIIAVLLPVIDDLDRAEKHGDLAGDTPFATIAAKLRTAIEKIGLTPFGAVGDLFDQQ